jgi:radical SAM protein with 4Fe4S-binding SPASM domain
MNTTFDRITEGARERDLMRRVRAGEITPADIDRLGLPFPVKIQIQTVSPCNAECVMCPWPSTRHVLPQGTMPEPVFHRIVSEIKGRGVERAGLFLMNEPTLDRRLPRLTAHLKREDPAITTVIFSNGVLLDGAKTQELADAGLDEIDVSVIGFTAEAYAKVMKGCDFDRVMRNLDEIAERQVAGRLGKLALKIVCLEFPGLREAADAFAARTGLSVYVKPVTNRAGLIDLDAIGVHNVAAPQPTACQRPFVKAYVLYNGDMVLCNCDWMRTTIIGNVMQESLEDLWRSQKLMEIRRHHLRGQLPAGSLCAQCDYPRLG